MNSTLIRNIVRDIVVFVLVACLALLPVAAVHTLAHADDEPGAGGAVDAAGAADAAAGADAAGAADAEGAHVIPALPADMEPSHPLTAREDQAGDAQDAAAPAESSSKKTLVQAKVDALSIPAYFLTNVDYVTPVKLQNPWGACWAFAIAAAVESSVLKAEAEAAGTAAEVSNMGSPRLTGLNDSVDLSERAIAWLAHEQQSEESAGSQAGEGYYRVDAGDPTSQLAGGNFSIVEAALTAGQSLVPEEGAPYRYNGWEPGMLPWYSVGEAGDARQMDWSIDDALRTANDFGWRVNEVIRLESPAVANLDASTGQSVYVGYDADATAAIKQTLVDVGGVAIALEADASMPESVVAGRDDTEPSAHFTYATWSQYDSAMTTFANHAVTIVGWDDNYSAANFAGTESGAPPGNGAWLCKNNWGSDALFSQLGAPGDATHWGLRDAEGAASGFFWLSYYDHTIGSPTAFCVQPAEDGYDTVYQYDYLSSSEYSKPSSYDSVIKVANVFAADTPELLRAVSAQTFGPQETVRVEVYALPDVASDDDAAEAAAGEGGDGDGGGDADSGSDADADAQEMQDALDDLAIEWENDAKSLIHARDVMIAGDENATGFFGGRLVATAETTFATGGFHTIALDKPVLLAKGQKFAVVQQVKTNITTENGNVDAYYLNLELAFDQMPADYLQETLASVVANDGETFVMMFDDEWMTLSEFNEWFAESRAEAGSSADLTYGNALIKAMTTQTSMGDGERVYELVELERS